MVLSSSKETSTVAGLIDFAFNIGASFAGIIVGIIIDKFSWSAVFLALAICAVATSILLMVFFLWLNRFKGRWHKSEQVSCID